MDLKSRLEAVEKQLMEEKEQLELNARDKHYESDEDLCNDIYEYVQTANKLHAAQIMLNWLEEE